MQYYLYNPKHSVIYEINRLYLSLDILHSFAQNITLFFYGYLSIRRALLRLSTIPGVKFIRNAW